MCPCVIMKIGIESISRKRGGIKLSYDEDMYRKRGDYLTKFIVISQTVKVCFKSLSKKKLV